MTTPRTKPGSLSRDEAWRMRQAIWRHNSFFGHVAMARANMDGIIHSETATDQAKQIAQQIRALTDDLATALKGRKNVR